MLVIWTCAPSRMFTAMCLFELIFVLGRLKVYKDMVTKH